MARRATRQPPPPLRRAHGRVIAYRRIVVCLAPADGSIGAVALACTLASEHRAAVTVVAAIEVPLDIPLDTVDATVQTAARDAIVRAQSVTETYGISSQGVLLHARDAGEAIVAELEARGAEVVLVAAERPERPERTHMLPATTEYILKQAPCPVMLIGQPTDHRPLNSFDPVFRAGRPSDYWPTGEFVDHIGTSEQAK
jgi:nucleotide-binding universal stress UspA family protein